MERKKNLIVEFGDCMDTFRKAMLDPNGKIVRMKYADGTPLESNLNPLKSLVSSEKGGIVFVVESVNFPEGISDARIMPVLSDAPSIEIV